MSEPLRAPGEGPVVRAPGGPGPGPAAADRRDYSFQSMLQLAGELGVSLGLHETADLLTLNLMGQFRAARSALWLLPDGPGHPVLVRSRGIPKSAAVALGTTCAAALRERFAASRQPVLSWALGERLGPSAMPLLEHAGVALFAPLASGDQLLGWLALGNRIDGQPYGARDFEVLGASAGIVGSSILNGRLYSRVLEANRLLRATNDRLGEMDRLKNEFVSNVNHELRTPLTITIGALECAGSASAGAPNRDRFVAVALENARHLASLVENLLSFSEVRRDPTPVRCETASMRETLEECFRQRRPGVAAGLRELTCECAPALLPATFDPARFARIVDELIDNAVKFTPQGSHIRLAADLANHEGREWVRVRVSDDGPGIPAARLPALFAVFEQVDGSSTRAVGGLGMGLALAQQLARCMGCVLSAASEPARGTVFTLLVPAAERRSAR